MKTFALSAAIAMCLIQSAFGLELSNNQKRAMSNLQADLVECEAYYKLVDECVGETNILARGAKASGSKIRKMSDAIALAVEMAPNDYTSRLNMATAHHRDLKKNNCANVSSLVSRYGNICKSKLDNAVSKLNDILDGKIDDK